MKTTKPHSEQRQLMNDIHLRLMPEMFAELDALAKKQDISKAHLARDILADHLQIDKSTIPVPSKSIRYPELVLELANARRDVKILTGALVQTSIKMRQDGHVLTHQEIEDLLPKLRKLAGKMGDCVEAVQKNFRRGK